MELRKNGAYYRVSPWSLMWDNEYYYLVAYDPEEKMIKHYRVDKMLHLSIIDKPIFVTGQDDAAKAEWFPLSNLPHLAFDHYDIIQDAIRVYKVIMK